MDRRTRKQQIATLSIIAVAVITLSIGFAAFSSTLRISSQASVNPNASAFSVIFSNNGTNTDTQQTVNPNSSTYGEAATITNGASPTIGGIKAKFTSPGQSVSYSFYAKNTGSYLAYLNYITFNNVEGASKNIVCTAQDGTTQDLVDSACEGISISIKVGNDEAVTTSQSGIQNHTLATGNSEPVIVTITYGENAALSDGDFTVAFGDISLTYSTVSDYIVEQNPSGGTTKLCTANKTKVKALVMRSDEDLYMGTSSDEEVGLLASTDGAYTPGVAYTCNFIDDNESNNMTFFVLSSTTNDVTLIAGSDLGETVAWSEDGDNHKNDPEEQQAVTAKAALADRTSTWGKLTAEQKATIKLPTKDQIEGAYTGAMPTWLYSYKITDEVYGYWTASPNVDDSEAAWNVHYSGGLSYTYVDIAMYDGGVRPVITLLKDYLNN